MNKRILSRWLLPVKLALLLCFCSLSQPSAAVEIYPNAGTTSAAFLKLGAGCRAVAMGSAYAGLADDASAIYWNPAGLAQLQHQELQMYHNESFENIRNDFLAYVHPLSRGVLSVGFSGLYTPKDIERRSGLNEADPYEPLSPIEGYFQAYDVAAHVAYGRWLRENLAAGVSLKFIQQAIDTESACGIGADIGLLYRMRRLPLSGGLVIQNIGTPIKFINKSYPLPLNFKLGAAWRWNKRVVTTLDFNKPIDNFLFIAGGAEYTPLDFVSLRVGYRYRWYGLELGDLSGLSAGAGFHFKLHDTSLSFDYAFVPFGVLGNSHRISIGLLFGTNARVSPARTASVHPYSEERKPAFSPALPQGPLSATADEFEGYTFRPAAVTTTRKMAAGNMVTYAVEATSGENDIRKIEGTIRMQAGRRLVIEIGEKPGNGPVYKHYAFRRRGSEEIQNITCTAVVPVITGSVVVRTKDGSVISPKKIAQDEVFITYQFNLATLAPFRIEKQ
jgi:hypothetical protein